MTPKAFHTIPLEEVRAYWDRRPCNLRHSPAPVGTREYFDQVEARKYFVEPHIPGFAEFEHWRGKRVLEIGCGIGTDTINFARHGAAVTAVDLSGQSMALARKRADVYGLTKVIDFVEGDAENLSAIVPIRPYDLVYSFGVIHHTPHPDRVIAQLKAYLSAQSELRIMLYSKVSYKLFCIMRDEGVWDMSRMDELVARNSEAQTGCPITYTYTFAEVAELLQGFTIVDIAKTHIFTWDVEAYKQYTYKKDAAWENVSEARLRQLESELGWHTLVRARLTA